MKEEAEHDLFVEKLSKEWEAKECCSMNEKIYKMMGNIGGSSIAMGVIVLVVGAATGIMMIINGARLLGKRGEITF